MRTGPTNPQLMKLIEELQKKAQEHESQLWKRLALDLSKPTRQRRIINLYKINEQAKEDEIVVVPGKVLSVGDLDHKVTVAAYSFSGTALDKINQKGKALTITELMKNNPKGKKIRILG